MEDEKAIVFFNEMFSYMQKFLVNEESRINKLYEMVYEVDREWR